MNAHRKLCHCGENVAEGDHYCRPCRLEMTARIAHVRVSEQGIREDGFWFVRMETDQEALRGTVFLECDNALDNGYAVDTWDPERLAADLARCLPSLNFEDPKDLLPHVKAWQASKRQFSKSICIAPDEDAA